MARRGARRRRQWRRRRRCHCAAICRVHSVPPLCVHRLLFIARTLCVPIHCAHARVMPFVRASIVAVRRCGAARRRRRLCVRWRGGAGSVVVVCAIAATPVCVCARVPLRVAVVCLCDAVNSLPRFVAICDRFHSLRSMCTVPWARTCRRCGRRRRSKRRRRKWRPTRTALPRSPKCRHSPIL